jgi:DNA replication protein DnaC
MASDEPTVVGEEVQKVLEGIKKRPAGMSKCGACHTTIPTADTVPRLHPQGGQEVKLCPDCAQKVDERQAAERQERASAEVTKAVGARYKDATWRTLAAFGEGRHDLKGIFERIGKVYASGRSLWFHGGTGTGKTFAAAVLFRDAMVTGRVELASFWPAADLADYLRQQSREFAVTTDAIAVFRTHGFMVIDDLMVEKATDFVIVEMGRVIDWRYRDGLQTIVTSNHSPRDVAATYGMRMISRLHEMCGPDGIIGFPTGDNRLDAFRPKGATEEGSLFGEGG